MAAKKKMLTDEEFISNTDFYLEIEELIENDWDPYEAAEYVMNKSCYSEKVKGKLAIKALSIYDAIHDTDYADYVSIEEENDPVISEGE